MDTPARTPYSWPWLSLGVALFLAPHLAAEAGSPPPAHDAASMAVVRHYISAVQRRDFRTAIEDTHSCKQEVARLKSQNPQVLWDRVLGEYFETRVKSLSSAPNYWQAYSESLTSMTGDSTALVRGSVPLLPPGLKWSITETRSERVADSLLWGPHTRITTYVIADYPSPEMSPSINGRPLKHTILVFVVHAQSHGLLSVSRVAKADELWPVPELNVEMATKLAQDFLSDKSHAYIAPQSAKPVGGSGKPILGAALPTYESPAVNAYRSMFTDAGFLIADWSLRVGWGMNTAQVIPPDSWSPYEHILENGAVHYYLEESVDIALTDFHQREGVAKAVAHVRRHGCNPVCQLVQKYWGSSAQKAISADTATHSNGFFAVLWDGLADPSHASGGAIPEEEDRSVTFEWQQAHGWRATAQALIPSASKGVSAGQAPTVNQRGDGERGASDAPIEHVEEYSPMGTGMRWEYSVKPANAPSTAGGTALVTHIDQKVEIGGKQYFEMISEWGSKEKLSKEVSFWRGGEDGLYSIDGKFRDRPEILQIPSAIHVGSTWVSEGPRGTMRCGLAGTETVILGWGTYDNALKVVCAGDYDGNHVESTTFLVRGVGNAKETIRRPEGTVEVTLERYTK